MERRVTVCVADDNVENATILSEGLKLHDFDTVQVGSGEEALEVCAQGGIDLILLDVGLPGINGYETCRLLKDNDTTAIIPVIFVTVKGEPEDISKGYKVGASDYITKPYNLPIVMVRVEAVLRTIRGMEAQNEHKPTHADGHYTDQLTGLRSGRYLLQRLQEEVDKAHRYDFPVSCVVFDIDEVSAVDDEVGPVSMDDLLAEIAIALRSHSRAYDVIARYDNTVFAALLPHSPLDDAMGYGTKIMEDVHATTFSDPNFPTKVVLSVGVVTCQNGSASGAERILGEAMRSLLAAKSKAESRIVGRDLSET